MHNTNTITNLSFEPIKDIGQHGRNSEVCLAKDVQLDCEIVVKKISKTKIVSKDEFFSEARKLNDSEHPNVVPLKFASEDANYIYIGMPYYPDGSLKDLIESRYLTIREVIRYGIQFLSGLNNIHSKKLVHFDIKPDNILLNAANEAMVSDFGLAMATNVWGMAGQDRFYSKHRAPEAIKTNFHSMLYDIYSAGLTLYRLCNGNVQFDNQFNSFQTRDELHHAIVNGQFPDRGNFLPHVPKKMRSIIVKALSINPSDRQQTVLQLMNELSLITESIDWEYSSRQDEWTWVNRRNAKNTCICLKKLANLYSIETTETYGVGKVRKIASACSKDLPQATSEKTLLDLLKTYG
ncbi:Serine/threonine protein kinase [Chitinophaga costaii]|uniref:Serine/threonine protein kinase n=1 Tax=Chitinophaga costaii TaxID=1335309 RepID=A0A1C4C3G8_9BACT|nr:serine/threonine-protein kinase [Chitinophaga costaii]PUZ27349.1 serine/threonine protein kinase [Chitinophaga costaii]SCC13676.1 Serine/threonine protein kinase [Chitinophaga costaii]